MKTAPINQTSQFNKLNVGKELKHTNKIIQWANVVAYTSVAAWLCLVGVIFYISGPLTEDNSNYQRLSPTLCFVSNMVASFELGAILLRIIHQYNVDGTKWIKRLISALRHCTIIMIIAIRTTQKEMVQKKSGTNRERRPYPADGLMDGHRGVKCSPRR